MKTMLLSFVVLLVIVLLSSNLLAQQGADWGDAPDSYGTTASASGAYHPAANVWMGTPPDIEPDGQPTSGADGDDNTGQDDEDGVTLPAVLIAGESASVTIHGGDYGGFVHAWIDFDRNGVFDSGDQIFSDLLVTGGNNSQTFNVPSTAVAGITYARFRINSDGGGIGPTGDGWDGEVEDYQVEIEYPKVELGNNVWYDTNANGIKDAGEPGISNVGLELFQDTDNSNDFSAGDTFVNSTVTDASGNYKFGDLDQGDYILTIPSNNFSPAGPLYQHSSSPGADDPDNDVDDDDNGIDDSDPLTNGIASYAVTLTPGTEPGIENADYNQTVDFGFYVPTGTIIVEKQTLPDGSYDSFTFTGDAAGTIVDGGSIVVSSLLPGTYHSTELVPTGWILESIVCDDANSSGDVNTATVTFQLDPGETVTATFTNTQLYDFGDAPDNFRTLLVSDGARHLLGNDFYMGASIDIEAEGLPTPGADGDDNDNTDDEDGVTLPAMLTPGSSEIITVHGGPNGGRLDAWIDYNRNGNFSDAGETLFSSSATVNPGAGNNYPISVPIGASPGITYARFRISSDGGLGSYGIGYDGEVEDYQVEIANPNADLGVIKEVDNSNPVVGTNVMYAITVTNNGPADATGVTLNDLLPAGVTFQSAAPDQGTYNETTGVWDIGSLANGASTKLEITATVITSGLITNTGTVVPGDQIDPNPDNNSDSAELLAFEYASIGDLVWNDINKNGIQDSGESGVENVTVELFNANGPTGLTTQTDANGNYGFADLYPGEYYIKVTLPAGYSFAPKDVGGDDTVDSDTHPTTGESDPTTLASGEDDVTWDAGIYKPVKITVATDPAGIGLQIKVDGVLHPTPYTFDTIAGAIHALDAPSPQDIAGARYSFDHWDDSGAQQHDIVAPQENTTYTAFFKLTHYFLATVENPDAGGNINPIPPGQWYAAGAVATVSATANDGWIFSGFTDDLSGTISPQDLTMDAPKKVTANFVPDIDFCATPTMGCPGTIVQFEHAVSVAVTDWFWDFGDDMTATVENPDHEYIKEGRHHVTLKITTPWGEFSHTKENFIWIYGWGPICWAPLELIDNSPAHYTEGWDNAIDNDVSCWDGTVSAGGENNEAWAIFQFLDGSIRNIDKVRLMCDTEVGHQYRWVQKFRVLVSMTDISDNSFTTVLNEKKTGGGWEEFKFDAVVAKYVKLIIDMPDKEWRQIGEFQVCPVRQYASEKMSSVVATSPHLADGVDVSVITIVVKDGNGNPIVDLKDEDFCVHSTGNDNIYFPVELTETAGTYQTKLASLEKGAKTIKVSVNGVKVGKAVVDFTGPDLQKASLTLVSDAGAFYSEDWTNAIDNDIVGYDGTVTVGGAAPFAIFQFADGSIKKIQRFRMLVDTGVGNESRWVKRFRLLVSTTGTSDVNFITVLDGYMTGGDWKEFKFPAVLAKYVKLIIDYPASGWRQLGEIEIDVSNSVGLKPNTFLLSQNLNNLTGIPENFVLNNNYPNPFNPVTHVMFGLPKKSHVTIYIYNVFGQRVRSLIDAEIPAGYHTILWDGNNDVGSSVSSGTYIFYIRTDENVGTLKMLLLK